jgi:DHA1 family tetracycline resistance protein-like MFS transporter
MAAAAPSGKRKAAVPFILVCILIDVLGFGLVIPVLPSIVGQFTTNPDAQAHWYGWLVAVYGVMQFLCSPILGALSDRFGRRPVMLIGMTGLGLDFLLQAFSPSLGWLFVARTIGGATAANFSVANAYIADVTAPEDRAREMGKIGAAFGIGFIVGPVLGGLLADFGLRAPFIAAAALSFVNVLYGWFVLPESLPKTMRAPFSWAKANAFAALRGLVALRGVGGLVWISALTVLAQFILHTTWVLFTTFRFGWTPRDNGISLFFVGLSAAIVQGVLLGRILKRWGEGRTALFGMLSATIAYLLYGLATQGWMMYVIVAFNGLSFAINPALQAMVSRNVDAKAQGVSMGALSAVASIMLVAAPLISTPIFAAVSHLPPADWRVGATFYTSAALQAITMLITLVHLKRHPASTSVPIVPASSPASQA